MATAALAPVAPTPASTQEAPGVSYAGKHKSYPIKAPGDVEKAARAIGRAGPDNYSTDELKRRIIAIAHRRGAEYTAQLPKAWREPEKESLGAPAQVEAVDDEPVEDDESLEARIAAVCAALCMRLCATMCPCSPAGMPCVCCDDEDDDDERRVTWTAPEPPCCPYVVRTWEDKVLYAVQGEYYLLDYTLDGDEVTLGDEPREADTLYAPEEPSEEESAPPPSAAPAVRKTLALTEAVCVEAADAPQAVLRVTLLKAGWSLNNRFYAPEVVQAAAPLFEGVRAFIDHPGKNDRPERSVLDQVGYYRGVTYSAAQESVSGDLKLIGAGDRTAHVLAWAQESLATGQPLIGVSINAIGETTEGEAGGREGTLVSRLVDADSCDVVTRPAAGGKFESLAASEGDSLTKKLLNALDYREWREARPEYAARLRKECQTVRRDELLAEATQKTTAVQAQLDEARTLLATADSATAERIAELEARCADLQTQVDEAATARAAIERTARAAALLERLHIPYVHRPRLQKQLDLLDEARWGEYLETELAALYEQQRAQPVTAAPRGPLVPEAPPAPRVSYTLPIAEDGMTVRDWQRQRDQQTRSN